MISIIEISASLIESIILTEFTTRALGFRSKKYAVVKYISYLLLSIADIIILPSFVNSDIIPGVVHLILTFTFALIFLKGSIFFKAFIAVLSNVAILIINIGVMTIFSSFTNLDFNGLIIDQTSTRILLLFTTKFIYFLFTRAMLKVFGKDRYPLTAHNWYIIISLLLLSITGGWIVFGINLYSNFNALFVTMSVILIVIINTATYIIMVALSKYNITKNEIKLLEEYQKDTEKEMNNIQSKNKEIHVIKHELKNTSMIIHTLIHSGKIEEADQLLDKMAKINLGGNKQFVKLKHNLIETIINSRLTMCENENISVKKIDIKDIEDDLFGIIEQDMCTIIGNLMDNAIEANRKCSGDKSIELYIMKQRGYIKICVINTAPATALSFNGKGLKTSKRDKENHGIGTQIINAISEKYNGDASFDLKDNKFIATVYLSCAKNDSKAKM